MNAPKLLVPAKFLDPECETPISPESALRILEASECKRLSQTAKAIRASGAEVTLEMLRPGLEIIRSALDYDGEAAQSSLVEFVR